MSFLGIAIYQLYSRSSYITLPVKFALVYGGLPLGMPVSRLKYQGICNAVQNPAVKNVRGRRWKCPHHKGKELGNTLYQSAKQAIVMWVVEYLEAFPSGNRNQQGEAFRKSSQVPKHGLRAWVCIAVLQRTRRKQWYKPHTYLPNQCFPLVYHPEYILMAKCLHDKEKPQVYSSFSVAIVWRFLKLSLFYACLF